MAGRWSSPRKKALRPTNNDAPGAMPSFIEPQLATLVSRAPTDGEWSYEIKFLCAPAHVAFCNPKRRSVHVALRKTQRCTSLCRVRPPPPVNNRRRFAFDIERTRAATLVEADNPTLKSAR